MVVHRNIKKNKPVFLHHINVRKRVKIFPYFHKHRITPETLVRISLEISLQ